MTDTIQTQSQLISAMADNNQGNINAQILRNFVVSIPSLVSTSYAPITGTTSITSVGTVTVGTWNATKVGLAYGGTNADLSASGGTGYVLKQTTVGGAITSAALVAGDIPTIAQSQVTNLVSNLATKYQSFLMSSGNYYFLGQNTGSSTSNTLGNANCRSIPVYFPNNVTLSRIGAEITSVGDSGCKLRLGIYSDNGSGYPGSLLIDAGTIAGDSATVQEITISQAVTAGLYWVCATVQGVTTTQPTVRVCSGLPGWFGGTSTPASAAYSVGFSQTASGALPSTFNTTVSLQGQAARIFVKIT